MRSAVVKEFTIGESLSWEKSFSDYPASDGWTVTYYFRGAGTGFDVVGTASGDDFEFTVAGTVTAGCAAGKYYYQAFATKGSESFLVDKGEANVLTGFGSVATGTTVDNRSEVKKTLDAIDARLQGDVTRGVLEYTIADRQLQRYSLKELAELRKVYASLYAQELQAENAKKGGSLIKNHYVKFNNPR
ncbi:MAG TPA: hypothetical protein VIL74_20660 [Pyrinomonadaceae bacterium]|jgi:hypothetical protein